MLVFIDESGDCGMKNRPGTSAFFIVTAVLFEDHEDAEACDERIIALRRELKVAEQYEFKFSWCSSRIRECFLRATAQFDYFYSSMVINKAGLWGEGFKYKEPFYKYTTKLVFENCKPRLQDAKVVIDKCGDREFREQLSKYLKSRINSKGFQYIRKVTMEASHANNLLQLADMVCGAVARCYSNKKGATSYRKIIAHRELGVQVWSVLK